MFNTSSFMCQKNTSIFILIVNNVVELTRNLMDKEDCF